MTATKGAWPIYHIKDSVVPDKIRRTQESSKDKPSMARYLQEPPGVAERIALNSKAPLEQARTHDQQHFVERSAERNYVQSEENVAVSPADDELMKELACLEKEASKARPAS